MTTTTTTTTTITPTMILFKEKRKLGKGKMKVYQLDEFRGKFEVRHTIILFFNTAEIPINDEVPALMAE